MPERHSKSELLVMLASVEIATARTLYETDEDITDEAVSALVAKGFTSWHDRSMARQKWDELAPEVQLAYVRRAKAALALIEDMLRNSPDDLSLH